MAKMKKLWNLHCGNKAYFFSIDVFIALFIVTIILSVSLLFISRSNDDVNLLSQQGRFGDDVVSVLEHGHKFDSLNKNTIINNINSVLPTNYKMGFRIECKNKIIQSFDNQQDNFISSGERVIVTNNLDYCTIRYWLWSV